MWIFKCDRCGKKSVDDEGRVPRRDGEHAATVTIKPSVPTDSSHPESLELCTDCHNNLYVWVDNLDVRPPGQSESPPAPSSG